MIASRTFDDCKPLQLALKHGARAGDAPQPYAAPRAPTAFIPRRDPPTAIRGSALPPQAGGHEQLPPLPTLLACLRGIPPDNRRPRLSRGPAAVGGDGRRPSQGAVAKRMGALGRRLRRSGRDRGQRLVAVANLIGRTCTRSDTDPANRRAISRQRLGRERERQVRHTSDRNESRGFPQAWDSIDHRQTQLSGTPRSSSSTSTNSSLPRRVPVRWTFIC